MSPVAQKVRTHDSSSRRSSSTSDYGHPRRLAVDAIVRETDCSRSLAKRTLRWIDGFVRASRENGYEDVLPRDEQMSTREYDVFDQIMPHGRTSRPGTAHAAVEHALLRPELGEYTIVHDNASVDGKVCYCTVRVGTRAVV